MAKHPAHVRKPRSDPVPSDMEVLAEHLSQQMTGLTATVHALNNKVNDLHAHNEALQQQVADLSVRNADLETKVSQLEARSSEMSGNLSQAILGKQNQQDSITTLETSVLALHDILVSSEEAHNTTIDALTKQVVDLQGDMSLSNALQNTTAGQLTLAAKNISEIRARMLDFDRVTSLLQTNTQSLTSSTGGLTNDVTALKEAERQLQASIQTLRNTDTRIFNDVSHVDAQVADVASRLQSLTKPVSFYARLSEKSGYVRPAAPTIILDEVLNNQGGGYSNLTGWFSAPVAGEYVFGATILPTRMGEGAQRVYLMMDDKDLFLTDGSHSSMQASLHLEAGQRVWLKAFFDSQFGEGTYLTGALVSPAP
nr:hypothetical protein BaRGS_019783 [Batillaria attramentaria]